MSPRAQLAFMHAIFLASGACGLGCQVVWTRLFSLGLGQEMPAVLAVVAAFFGGFALGAASLDGRIARSHRPEFWYAGLELVIGVWVLASIRLIPMANQQALEWTGLEPSVLRQAALAFGVPLLTLLPATAAMGATFPAMTRFAAGMASGGRVAGSLYAANTLGAMLGTLGVLSLVYAHGFSMTLMLLGCGNLACALALTSVALASPGQRQSSRPTRRATKSSSEARTAAIGTTGISSQRLIATLLGTGFLGIGLEVLSVRVLKLVLEDTIYTFARLLAVYLLGTAFGAAAVKPLQIRWPRIARLDVLLTGLAVTGGLSGWALWISARLYPWLVRELGDSFHGTGTAEFIVAACVFVPPSLFMGATFATLAEQAREIWGGVGRALAWNTLGGALAPALVGFAAFPILGAKGTLAALVSGYVLLRPGLFTRHGLAALAPLALALVLLPELRLTELLPGEKLRTLREGVSDSVAVVETSDGHRTLRANNRFTMGGTASVNAERRQAHIPLLLHPGPKRALFLGSATGITAAAATKHPELAVDSVELVPEIVAVMPEFSPANDPGHGPFRQFTADARRFVRTITNQYDVIVADLFHPARDGAGALYTREHFRAIRARLAPGGLFCQWVPLYQTDERTLNTILATFRSEFRDASLWLLRLNLETPVVGLVGGKEPQSGAYGNPGPILADPSGFAARTREVSLYDALKAVGLSEPAQLACLFIPTTTDVGQGDFVATDNQPRVGFEAPRGAHSRSTARYATLFKLLNSPDQPGARAPSDAATVRSGQLQLLLAARDQYLQGLRFEAEGNTATALDAFIESARLSEDFTTGYAHAITLAVQASKDNPARARQILERLASARPERPVARELLERLFPTDQRPSR